MFRLRRRQTLNVRYDITNNDISNNDITNNDISNNDIINNDIKISHFNNLKCTYNCKISLSGRLGNHLFQIATLLRHCFVNNLTPIFSINHNIKSTQHYYKNTGVLYKCGVFLSNEDIHSFNSPFNYIPIPADAKLLSGFYQSSRYFSDISGQIRFWFDPHPLINRQIKEKYSSLLSYECIHTNIIIHVRRGDYQGNPMFGILTETYYIHAMNEMKKILGDKISFLIFSDDIHYCTKTFNMPNVLIIDEPDESIALHLMSKFKHYILSNSSFSWWASYLGEPSQTIIAPDKWFGMLCPEQYEDIFEPHWIRINCV